MSVCEQWAAQTPWLRRLPKHWALRRFKSVCRASSTTNEQHLDRLLSLSATRGVVPKTYGEDQIARTGEDLERYWVVESGQLVVNPMWVNNGSVACSLIDGVISPDYRVYDVSPEVDPRFLHHLLKSREYLSLYALFVRGETTYDRRVSKDDFNSLPIPVPDIAVQRRVGAELDQKVEGVAALMAIKNRQIRALRELALSLIGQAASSTKVGGRHPEWLGSLPANWRVNRGRYLFRELCLTPDASDRVVTAFRDGQVVLRDLRRADGYTFAVQEVGYQHVRVGDLVVHSMDAFAGAIGVSESTGKCSPEYIVLEMQDSSHSTRYFAECLRFMARQDYIRVVCPSVRERAPRLRFSSLRDLEFPVPPPDEQQSIVVRLHLIDDALKALSKQVERLEDVVDSFRSEALWLSAPAREGVA